MKYGRNKIKHIFRDGISCLYLDEEQDDFCNFVEKLQQEKKELKEWLEERIENRKNQIQRLNEKVGYGEYPYDQAQDLIIELKSIMQTYQNVLEKLGE